MFRALLAAALVALSTPAFAEKIRFAVTDIEGLEVLQQEFGPFEKALEKSTGPRRRAIPGRLPHRRS